MSEGGSQTQGPSRRRTTLVAVLVALVAWAAVAVPVAAWSLTEHGVETVVAGHDATVTPTLDGAVHMEMGPYLPDLRFPAPGVLGVDVVVGKTSARSAGELADRYAAIAARPEAEVRRVVGTVDDQVAAAIVRGTLAGLVLPGLWLLLGPRRRAELRGLAVRPGRTWPGRLALLGVAALVVALLPRPWDAAPPTVRDREWIGLAEAYPDVVIPQALEGWEVQGGIFTQGTQRLLESALSTYDKSTVFYEGVTARVSEVADQLRTPEPGETVAVLVSDRHDNIGMDQVVRAAADAAGATVVLDAGDDTSTGEPWEAFSLDSLDLAFQDYEHRLVVLGNHDSGDFVGDYLGGRGWTRLDGSPVEIDGVRVDGVDDPRSSGLGSWRDETELTFAEVEEAVADDTCARDEADDRVAVLLVHDANLGRTALARGCTDLVLAGHLHVQVGPDLVEGENGQVGWSYTNGTTGGAAYALAIGSKLRRDAQFTFVTFADGRPTGLQPVTVRTTGDLVVDEWIELDPDAAPDAEPGNDLAGPAENAADQAP